MFGKWKVLFHVRFHHKKKQEMLYCRLGVFVDLQEAMWPQVYSGLMAKAEGGGGELGGGARAEGTQCSVFARRCREKKTVDTLCLCAPLLNDLVCDASRTCVRLNSFWLPLAIKQGVGLLHPFLCLKFSPLRCWWFFSVKRTSSLINVSSLIIFFWRSSLM